MFLDELPQIICSKQVTVLTKTDVLESALIRVYLLVGRIFCESQSQLWDIINAGTVFLSLLIMMASFC